MIKRILLRPLILAVMTTAALGFMQPITLGTGWPEVMQCMKAAAILAWAEFSIMLIRLAVQPRLDSQNTAILGHGSTDGINPIGAATVYAVHQFTWAVRLAAFIVLYGWL